MLLRRPTYLLLLLLIMTQVITGQEVLSYEGAKQLGTYEGQADYQYRVVDGDTLLDGPFQMQRSNLESLLEKEDYSFLFEGAFENDYPVGPWTFRFATYQSNSQSQVVDYQYRVLVSGTQEDASGVLKKGRPHGPWTYTVNQIKDSEVEKLLFKSSITFENGIPQRSFQIENDTSTLVGRFLRNGLAHDQWSLYSTDGIEAEEDWFFDDGLLQKIEVNGDGSIQSISVYDGSPSIEYKTIQLGLSYINALRLHLQSSRKPDVFPSGVQTMLAQNASYYEKIDNILSQLGESDFSPKFRVKVPHYPLDSVEVIQLDSIKALFYKSKKIAGTFLDNTQLNILKLSDREANFQYEVIKVLADSILNPTEKLLEYRHQGNFEFISREQLVKKLWPHGFPAKSIEVQTDSTDAKRLFSLPNPEQYRFEGTTLSSIKELVRYASVGIDSIQKGLNEKLAKEQRQQELIALEERLIAQNKNLHKSIDSATTNASISAKETLRYIDSIVDKKLADYSNMQEVEAKVDYAKQLVLCYNQLQSLVDSIGALPVKWRTIQEKYQDRIWNPFMATLMDEEVKKRITGAYRKVLVPYFFEQIRKESVCDHAGDLVRLMQDSYQRMLQLRDEDTSKLERKLRREEDPQVVLQLFNLQAIDQN